MLYSCYFSTFVDGVEGHDDFQYKTFHKRPSTLSTNLRVFLLNRVINRVYVLMDRLG